MLTSSTEHCGAPRWRTLPTSQLNVLRFSMAHVRSGGAHFSSLDAQIVFDRRKSHSGERRTKTESAGPTRYTSSDAGPECTAVMESQRLPLANNRSTEISERARSVPVASTQIGIKNPILSDLRSPSVPEGDERSATLNSRPVDVRRPELIATDGMTRLDDLLGGR